MKTIAVKKYSIPSFMYGTAWKEEKTEKLVISAIEAGFRSIDTANQRKHYHEAGVGEGIDYHIKKGTITREDLFLQTKFTYLGGQDHRIPYDPKASYKIQVNQSFESSLEHLKTDYIDSYILHGPSTGYRLSDTDYQVWETMEELCQSGKVKLIGVSNVNYEQLELIIKHAKIPPSFVQNRCFAIKKWDSDIRTLCKQHNITYQGFSLLTANIHELHKSQIKAIIQKYDRPLPQIIFRFALQIGMLPLTGTTNSNHMKDDLKVYDFELTQEEINIIENIAIS